ALAPPLLRILGIENFGVRFSGRTRTGKSTLLSMMGAAWGKPVGSWLTTLSALEREMRRSNDGLLALDEEHLAGRDLVAGGRTRFVSDATFSLSKGLPKSRWTEPEPEERSSFIFVSTRNPS